MKFSLGVVNIALASLAAATPLSSPNEPVGLEDRDSGSGCKYDDKRCCKYQDSEYPSNDWDYPEEHNYKKRHTIYVKHGKSIQSAINKASCGDKIVVAPGTYAEQITIDKDGIQLIGHNAIIVPPAKPYKNTCSGLAGPKTEAGICVTGSGIKFTKFVTEHKKVISVKTYVDDVLITGFQVNKFSGLNIAVVGARNARVTKNSLTDGAKYGALTVGSINSHIDDNFVTASVLGSIGICMDNQNGVLVNNNHVSNHYVGLCVQTKMADVQYNHVEGCCFGVFIDPYVYGAKIRHNIIGANNPICKEIGFAAGIVIDGAIKSKVLDNVIEDQKIGGKGTGIALVDDECTEDPLSVSCKAFGQKAESSGNIILRNIMRRNDLDIFVNTTGHGNIIACNECSLPKKLCK
ncbi:pectin lyase fold/virulence factor [Ilyonectria destructans]|nr:pectin lyase fold/virulence factor [Ilyonectria destructans]